MASGKQFQDPRGLLPKIVARLSGKDKQIWVERANILDVELQIQTERIHELIGQLDARERRLHPYAQEALSLLSFRAHSLIQEGPEQEIRKTQLGDFFTEEGSDKATRHSYAHIYERLLAEATDTPAILEVGIGSLNAFPYAGLPPGGSLRAWRRRYPEALVVGMDIDLDSVDSVEPPAYVVDQTNDESLRDGRQILEKFGPLDLIVDDGFHDPHANVRTMLAFFCLLRPGGFYVVEDIHESLIDFWRLLAERLPGTSYVLDLSEQRPECDDNILFIARA